MRRLRRAVLVTLALLLVVAGAAGLWLRAELQASLALLDGRLEVRGLGAPVEVHRDALGIPTIRGATRDDVALATGFVHAQDRFFQMDLARRRAAGELSALVGPAAIGADRQLRLHRFRTQAGRALALVGDADRRLLEAYTAGDTAGLAALDAPPFEYLVLRQAPAPWRAEDSLLVVLAMFVMLQDDNGSYEETFGTLADVLPAPVVEFLVPPGTEWDAPIAGPRFAQPPVPGPDVHDPRAQAAAGGVEAPLDIAARPRATPAPWTTDDAVAVSIGSNNWAVSGARTADGAPLLANDMHLGLQVPNTWYRADLQWPAGDGAGALRRLVGVTLPGVPSLVAGSNGAVAWGFTNSYADSSDIVLLEIDPADPERYLTPDGWRRIERHEEVIEVAGADPVRLQAPWTIWGPMLAPDARGRSRAYRWTAHAETQLAANLRPLEDARTVDEALTMAHGIGTPVQNLMVAGRDGRIAWTLYGSVPRRVGFDGTRPVSWGDGTARWDGWLDDSEIPRVVDPADGRLWTANARVVGGPGLEPFAVGNHDVGSRATIIRDRLQAQDRFTPREMLDLQLDASATFLERWRTLLLDTLTDGAVSGSPTRAALRAVVAEDWSGQASPDSAGYRMVSDFRDAVADRVFALATIDARAADPGFTFFAIRAWEGPLWALVASRPAHWLEPGFASWDALLLDAADRAVAAAMEGQEGALADRVWGEVNAAPMRHPLSPALPYLGRWLDMPFAPRPGSEFTPRQQIGTLAASERLVVSPGNEATGILHMPGGQSGHPLSPYYANGHEAWVRGEATPLLPEPAEHRLTLAPPAGN
jgi:penicillin amidase